MSTKIILRSFNLKNNNDIVTIYIDSNVTTLKGLQTPYSSGLNNALSMIGEKYAQIVAWKEILTEKNDKCADILWDLNTNSFVKNSQESYGHKVLFIMIDSKIRNDYLSRKLVNVEILTLNDGSSFCLYTLIFE